MNFRRVIIRVFHRLGLPLPRDRKTVEEVVKIIIEENKEVFEALA